MPTVLTAWGGWASAIPFTACTSFDAATRASRRRFIGVVPAWDSEPVRVTSNQRCPCRSEEHTSELQSLMRISYADVCLKKKKTYTKLTMYQNTTHQVTEY